jgi:hypothetical protein
MRRIEDLLARMSTAMADSELVRTVTAIKADEGISYALESLPIRPLATAEINRLEWAGNSCADWSRIRVAHSFDCRRVRNCQFYGDVVLGQFARHVPLFGIFDFPSGIERATLANCVIGNDALIRDVRLIVNSIIGRAAILFDCGSIDCDGQSTFGNGQSISLGVETGGREVSLFAEIDVDSAAAVAEHPRQNELRNLYQKTVAEYVHQVHHHRTVIGRGAVIRSTPAIHNAYIGPYARIDGATLVANSTLLSSDDEPTVVESGACVTDSILQWSSRASTLAVIGHSVLTEHSSAEDHARVRSSIIGPNSALARGEVTASLVGPFVNMHHESLLIASIWPEGRGNVSAGALAGANHTSKAPDQEYRPGEGAFLGLGVKIAFPTDLTRAPYTLLAGGATALPQRVLFPFSLIKVSSEHYPEIPAAYNEIIPAWCLIDNFYALYRNEMKYRTRNKARRTRFDFRILRPAIVDLMRDAGKRLHQVQEVKSVYTERDIAGLGKNYMKEESRRQALNGYDFYANYYALLELKNRVESILAGGNEVSGAQLLCEPSTDETWEHARRILIEPTGFTAREITDARQGLNLLAPIVEQIAAAVEKSKRKDDERGQRIMSDYADVHTEAAQDPIVLHAWTEARRLRKEIIELLGRIK